MSKDKRKYPHRVPYIDAHTVPEDDRIRAIGAAATADPGAKIGCIVEIVEEAQHAPKGTKITKGGKGDRYIRKMAIMFPHVEVEYRGSLEGIAANTECIRFRCRSVLPADLASATPPEAN